MVTEAAPANPPAPDRDSRWAAERRRILAARAAVRRQAEDSGETLVYFLPEPPAAVPDWYEKDDSGPPRIEHARSSEPSNTITMPYGPLGRPPEAGAGELTPEQVFARASVRDRIKSLLGVELPL